MKDKGLTWCPNPFSFPELQKAISPKANTIRELPTEDLHPKHAAELFRVICFTPYAYQRLVVYLLQARSSLKATTVNIKPV